MIIAYTQLNCRIHQLFIGVTDADPTLGPEETAEGEEEAREVPLGLEEWTAEGPVQLMSRRASCPLLLYQNPFIQLNPTLCMSKLDTTFGNMHINIAIRILRFVSRIPIRIPNLKENDLYLCNESHLQMNLRIQV